MELATDVDATMLLLQIVSCAKCRYKYELVSGDVVSIDSEEIRLVFFHLYFVLLNRFFHTLLFPYLLLCLNSVKM